MKNSSFFTWSSSALLIIGGIICIVVPFVSSSLIGTLFIARMLLFCGIVHAFRLIATRGTWPIIRAIPPVLVPVIIGLLILVNNSNRARGLTVILMIFFVLDGFFKIVASIESGTGRINVVSLISAALSFFLAFFLAAIFPAAPMQLLALFLGLDLISMGIAPTRRGLPKRAKR
ncbi:DUF308 domain-containing protein [Paraburkholderia sp.]|uniref:DUF308 domain-containing protein n=1 Tax=Paraburkholderia sp. TaxID=1926495 RepID=UPI0025D3D0C3|nr:DUF308 domain-containing protein [Paraburkholderia sp.]